MLYVMCAHDATRGGFLPVAVLSFSSGVFNLHGDDEKVVTSPKDNSRTMRE